MTIEKNIRAILECNLPIIQTEIIDIIVRNIMALKQEPKTGHWIYKENN